MNKILFFFLIIVSTSLSGQTLEVVYDMQIDMSGNMAQPINQRFLLTNSKAKSVQKNYLREPLSDRALDKDNRTRMVVKIGNDTTYIYKDFINQKLFSEEKIFTKVFDVVDELNIFNWKIEPDTLTLHGYACRKATVSHRGREYVAYFSEELPFSDGPWKFNGLPGLILKVMMVNSNSIFSIEVSELRFSKKFKEVINPFERKKTTTFAEFKKQYNKKYSELESYTEGQSGSFMVQRGGIELLSND